MSTAAETRIDGAILQAALGYGERGLCVVPLADGDKNPRIREWQNNCSKDEAVIARWWQKWPKANVGIRLGEMSCLIDIETDDPAGDADLIRLFDGDPPVCPTFTSTRGKHRLFKWREDLPGGAVVHFGKLEVRTGNGGLGAQSVFPPSIHPSGAVYTWLVPLDEVKPPPLPTEVISRLWACQDGDKPLLDSGKEGKSAEDWEKISAGVAEGGRNESAASFIGAMMRDMSNLNDANTVTRLWAAVTGWNLRNKPPLPDAELKRTFNSILKRERHQRIQSEAEAELSPHYQIDPEKNVRVEQPWRLVVVTSTPKQYKVFSPMWPGVVNITSRQYLNPTAVRGEVLEQTSALVPDSFNRMWRGTRDKIGLARKLIETADYEEDANEAKRPFVIAEHLYHALTACPRILQDGEEYDDRGLVCINSDGDYVFSFREVFHTVSRSDDKIKRYELSALLRELGAKDLFTRISGIVSRRKTLLCPGFVKLQAMLNDENSLLS